MNTQNGSIITQDKLDRFTELLEREQIAELVKLKLDCEGNLLNTKVSTKDTRKYIKIDVGGSGKYMLDKADGIIYGIKAYGVIHRGHAYGTLDTIDEWQWSRYTAFKK